MISEVLKKPSYTFEGQVLLAVRAGRQSRDNKSISRFTNSARRVFGNAAT